MTLRALIGIHRDLALRERDREHYNFHLEALIAGFLGLAAVLNNTYAYFMLFSSSSDTYTSGVFGPIVRGCLEIRGAGDG